MRNERGSKTLLRWGSVLLGLVLIAPPSLIGGEMGAVRSSKPDNGVWITLGSDAFATLTADGDLRYGLEPLRALAERSGVVLTRVAGSDIERVSARLHEAFRRCPGFIVHDSIGEALSALAGVDRAAEPVALSIDQGPWVERLEMSLGGLSILGTIGSLSTNFVNRYYLHPAGVDAAHWIHDQWQTLAVGHPEVTVEFFGHPWAQPSVILTIPGTSLSDEVVVLGGHLDSVSPGSSNPGFLAPGADDNASGIAVLTAVIRAALQHDFRPQRTVQFMGYAAEEVGLRGSGEIAAAYAAAGVDVVAVLQLDMTGYKGSVEDIGLLGDNVDPTLTTFVRDLVTTYQPELTWASTACGYACSDHASWTARGFAAAMPFESRVGQHNPEIHTTDDTLATLGNSAAHALKFARLAAAFLVEVAKPAEIFADGFESGSTDRWTTTVP